MLLRGDQKPLTVSLAGRSLLMPSANLVSARRCIHRASEQQLTSSTDSSSRRGQVLMVSLISFVFVTAAHAHTHWISLAAVSAIVVAMRQWHARSRAVTMLDFHSWYDSGISAMNISQYRYQSDISTLRMIHGHSTYFLVCTVRKAA